MTAPSGCRPSCFRPCRRDRVSAVPARHQQERRPGALVDRGRSRHPGRHDHRDRGRQRCRQVRADQVHSRHLEKAAEGTLRKLSVTSLRSIRQKVGSLSDGQRQAVAIARSVLWNSKLVIMDEPTAALGVAQTRVVLDLVRRLADRGVAVATISHNTHEVFSVADRVAVLYLGQMVAVRRSHTSYRDRRGRRVAVTSPAAGEGSRGLRRVRTKRSVPDAVRATRQLPAGLPKDGRPQAQPSRGRQRTALRAAAAVIKRPSR